MCSGDGSWTFLQLGFPIRKPPDHSSVANSPGLIAGSYVLLRLLVPRHSPCALSSLSPQRCSRPLCSSQHAGGPDDKPRLPEDPVVRGLGGPREVSGCLIPQDPTVCLAAGRVTGRFHSSRSWLY